MQKKYAGMDYEEVVRLFSDYITRMCVVWTQNSEAAKDCFQNTFLKLYQTSKEFHDTEHIKAWLLTVARNECRDYHRTFWNRNVDTGYTFREESTNLLTYYEETSDLVEKLHSLPIKYREVLMLYYYQGYDVKEMAEILRINVNTVKSRLRRGREKLAKIIQHTDETNGG